MLKRGMSQRAAISTLQKWGFVVERRRGTGELFIRHPSTPKPIVMKANRKDVPSAVVRQVNRILAAQAIQAA